MSALAHKAHRTAFYLLLAACAFGVVGTLVTILINVPLNQQVAAWSADALPPGYEDVLRRWWEWHQVRMAAMLTGMCLGFAAMLVRK